MEAVTVRDSTSLEFMSWLKTSKELQVGIYALEQVQLDNSNNLNLINKCGMLVAQGKYSRVLSRHFEGLKSIARGGLYRGGACRYVM